MDRLTTAIERLLKGFTDDQIAAVLVCGTRDDRIPKGAKGYDYAKACGLINEQGGIVHADKFETALNAEFDRRFGAASAGQAKRHLYFFSLEYLDTDGNQQKQYGSRTIDDKIEDATHLCLEQWQVEILIRRTHPVHGSDCVKFISFNYLGDAEDRLAGIGLFATEAEARASLKVENQKEARTDAS